MIIFLWANGFLYPPAGIGSEHSAAANERLISQKMPTRLLQELAAGRYQDLIVEFEHRDIREEAAARRQARRLRFNDDQIVTFKAARFRELKKRIFDAIRDAEFNLIREYKHLPMAFVRFKSKRAAEGLALHPEVKALHVNLKFYPHLSESLPFINQPDLCACGYGGGDTVVAVLDTGVDYTRPAFGSCNSAGDPGCRVIAAYEAAPDDGMLDDSNELHGTNVAGIALGVAPDSRIAAVDVFRRDVAHSTDIIAGIDWVIDQKVRGSVNTVAINLSLGTNNYLPSECTSSSLRTAIQNARSAGIMTVASSGNDGMTDRVSYPACIPEVASVGAVYDNNIGVVSYTNCTDSTTAPDRVTCFSNSSSDLTLLAPGADILTGGTGIPLYGTSQAAPHVAGAVAVLRSAFPADSLDDTLSRLQNVGVPVRDWRNNITKPRLSFENFCTASDRDNDCAADSIDNCPSVFNPGQADADGDGLGDLCDDCPNDPHNDLDGDGICGDIDPDDDGDDMPDAWEAGYGLDPLDYRDAAGDLDGDQYTNLQEYTYGTDPADKTSRPIQILEVIPHDKAGIELDQTRVPSDTSFSACIASAAEINIDDLSSIRLTVNDGSARAYNPYHRDLGDDDVVRIIELGSDPPSAVKKLWVVYDRSKEAAYGSYGFDAVVNIKVDVKDKNGIWMPQAGFDFRIESQTEHDQAVEDQPDSSPVDPDDPALTWPYNTGIEVKGEYDHLAGAKIIYSSDEPVKPRFGPEGELPELSAAGEEIVGIPMNLQPPNVFNIPVKIFVPCPGFTDVSRIKLYWYNGTAWLPALDENGNVLPEGRDFIVPNSRVNHNNGDPSTVEIQLYHFSGLQAAATDDVDLGTDSSPPQITGGNGDAGGGGSGSGGGGGGGCFIDSIKTSFEQ